MSNSISKVLNKSITVTVDKNKKIKKVEKSTDDTDALAPVQYAPEPHPIYTPEEIDALGKEFYDSKMYKRGFIYLIWVARAMENQESVFKLGMTEGNSCIKRLKSYDIGGMIIFYINVNNPSEVEAQLKKKFSEKFDRDAKYGNEYFAGNYADMIRTIYNFVFKHGYYIHPYMEALASKYKVVHAEQNGDKIIDYGVIGPKTKAARLNATVEDYIEEKNARKKNVKSKNVKKVDVKTDNAPTVDVSNNGSSSIGSNNNNSSNTSSNTPVSSTTIDESDNTRFGRTKHIILTYNELSEAVKGLHINYKDARDPRSVKNTDKENPNRYKFVLKLNIGGEIKYGVYQSFEDRVTSIRPDVYECESVYFFTSIPDCVASNVSKNNYYYIPAEYELSNIASDATSTRVKPSKQIKYIQYKDNKSEVNSSILTAIYAQFETLPLSVNELKIINDFEKNINEDDIKNEVLERLAKYMSVKKENKRNKRKNKLPVENKSGAKIITENTLDTETVKNIDEVSEELSHEDIKELTIGFESDEDDTPCKNNKSSLKGSKSSVNKNINGARTKGNAKNTTAECDCVEDESEVEINISIHTEDEDNEDNIRTGLSMDELLSNLTTPKDSGAKSISLTEFITRFIKYIGKSKDIMKSLKIENKSQIAKCRVLINSVIERSMKNSKQYYFAVPMNITMIGHDGITRCNINLKLLQEFINNNYGRTEFRFRLTPKQTEKYENNKVSDPDIDYNIFVHNCKKKIFRRREYYDITITPENVKIPTLR